LPVTRSLICEHLGRDEGIGVAQVAGDVEANYSLGLTRPPDTILSYWSFIRKAHMSASPIPLSYGLLAAIGESGASTPELVEMLSRGHMYHSWSPSQVYAEPKRLLALGWVTGEKQPGKTRSRTVYRLTDAGREALREHLRQPAGWPRIQHDAAQRLFAGDMISDEEILISLRSSGPMSRRCGLSSSGTSSGSP
jgi:DNA-binding PadR family transcriptional regulator